MPDRSKKRKKNKNKRKNKNVSQSGNSDNLTNTSPGADCSDNILSEINESCEDSKINNEIISSIQSNSPKELNKLNEVTIELKETESVIEICDLTEADKNHVIIEENVCCSSNDFVKSPEELKKPEKENSDDIELSKVVVIQEFKNYESNTVPSLNIDNALLIESGSDVQWETADDFSNVTLKVPNSKIVDQVIVNNLSMNIAECEHTQALTPEEESSLRLYLQTLDLATCPKDVNTEEINRANEPQVTLRLRTKSSTDEINRQKQRFLEVIDEEGSNESSINSRRQSDLKDEFDDLEDDVFQENKSRKIERMEKFLLPQIIRQQNKSHFIPQECLLVGAKIFQPLIEESCGEWTIENVETVKGAELIYLTDSSSSTSDIYDINEESENKDENDDSNIRIQTPTIEINQCIKFMENTNDYINLKNVELDAPSSPQIIISDESTTTTNLNYSIDESKQINVKNPENDIPSLVVLKIDEKERNDENKCVTDYCQTKSSELLPKQNQKKKSSLDSIFTLKEPVTERDTEINNLKVELNNALTNLMTEVVKEKGNNINRDNSLMRQDSSSSIESSQCTVKYNPTTSSLTDINTLMHETCETSKSDTQNNNVLNFINDKESHVKDVFERVTGSELEKNSIPPNVAEKPILLKDLCLQKITSLPYGQNILEELASVSARLQHINLYGNSKGISETMPFYPLPDVSSIRKVALPTKKYGNIKPTIPPPVAPRNSSLKIPHDELSWTGLPSKRDPSLYVCLSPSQKMLMEKTNTKLDEGDVSELLDVHKKYIDRRGYNEIYSRGSSYKTKDVECDALPFRSKTGNRLLAIIRDPGSKSINTKLNKENNLYQSLSYSNIHKEREPIRPKYSNSARDLTLESSFRPIPPPRPRKYSSTVYESDESSDFTDHSFQSINDRKYFHYSTGTLNKEIEKDVSNIQNLHRKYTNVRDTYKEKYLHPIEPKRRPSLPKDLCEQQMEYIRQKEKEVEAEIRRLEKERDKAAHSLKQARRAPLLSESETTEERHFDGKNYHISRKRDVAIYSDEKQNDTVKQISSSFKSSQEEIMRDKMYSEYVNHMAEREERKQHKVIKITTKPVSNDSKSMSKNIPILLTNDIRTGNNRIEEEFILKAKERWDKLGIRDPETEDERDKKDEYSEPKSVEQKIKVIEGGREKDVLNLPNHLREFVQFTAKSDKDSARSPGESKNGPSFFIVICAVVIVMLAIGKRMTPYFKD